MERHVVMYSGGITSWMTARLVVADHGSQAVTLLFADTGIEDEDVYRFILDSSQLLGATLVTVKDGRTPWEVFRDVRRIGSSQVAPCSHILKQVPARKWMEQNTEPAATTVYLGLDWTEVHRIGRAAKHWLPWGLKAPLAGPPYYRKAQILDLARLDGLIPPRSYGLGFPHANCGGFCVRQGQAAFAHLLAVWPDRYRQHEASEESMRQMLGKDVSIMRDRSGGTAKPLTMRALRERVVSGGQLDLLEWGGCGCFVDATGEVPA